MSDLEQEVVLKAVAYEEACDRYAHPHQFPGFNGDHIALMHRKLRAHDALIKAIQDMNQEGMAP